MTKKTPLRWLWQFVKWLLITLIILVVAIAAFLTFAPTFGGSPSGASLDRIKASPNAKDLRFFNLVDTTLDTRAPDKPMDISTYLFPPQGKNPETPLPSKKLNSTDLTAGQFVWLGHSTVLFNDGDLIVLADPVFNRASPVPLVGNPFPIENTPVIDDLPAIDVVIISHDHYDHLDHIAIADLESKTKQFLVPLGNAAHLERWGIPATKITELDWYQDQRINNTLFTLTPSRHFSGRGINNRFSTLWGSWVVKSETHNVFFSGDTGYFNELKNIGQTYGPFDIAFLENGAYSADWMQIHMMPEEAAQAAIDLQAELFFPIHWSKFDLAQHQWDDPIIRATAAAEKLGVRIATPMIGEVFNLENTPQQRWWE